MRWGFISRAALLLLLCAETGALVLKLHQTKPSSPAVALSNHSCPTFVKPQSLVLNASALTKLKSQTKASCSLPAGAMWCNGYINGGWRKLAVYNGPDPVSNVICQQGVWEFDSVSDMGIHESGAGKTLVDVGANIGWFSVLFADAGYKVFAIEPMVENRKLIEATLCQNPDLVSKIEIVPMALAQKPTQPGETCDVYSCDCNLGDGLLVCKGEDERRRWIETGTPFNHVWREAVPTMTLDQLMTDKGMPAVDVIKMDVEGYECKVIEGGAATFRRPNYIMAEVRGDTASCTMTPLTDYGFVAHDGSFHGVTVNSRTRAAHSNLFFARN